MFVPNPHPHLHPTPPKSPPSTLQGRGITLISILRGGFFNMFLAGRASRRASIVAQPFRVKLHAWNASKEDVAASVDEVKSTVLADMQAGSGGVVECVGAKSAIAVIKGLTHAEGELSKAKHDSPFGVTSAITVRLDADSSDYHTFRISYTADGFAFPEQAKIIDVLDKSELPQDIYQWAATTPTDYHNDRPLDLDFDKNSPPWEKSYTFSGRELVELLTRSPTSEAILRGMGPSLFNCFKTIAHAQEAFGQALPFGIIAVKEDAAVVSTFQDEIKDYFERGMVHFREEGRLPAKRADGIIHELPPEV